ncbi:RICIN domain-containing protein [Actinoplanes solisilvae]|uniref:RICIN domain-containing protein n=1 Tax=Actinoplanes solisilvae TaxID=2486853 RepID=UPI001F0BA96A|nr:RICIN domain-containing protein [Actinoplanes solisilvae]
MSGLGKCLDVANNSTADGAVVHLWDCIGTVASQKWTVTAGRDVVNGERGEASALGVHGRRESEVDDPLM